jgi:tripartite-type tricarboxylate transporter receptor subunit TctC
MPPAVSSKLSRTIVRVLADPHVKARLVGDGWEAIGSSPEAFRAVMQSQIDYYGNLIKKHAIKAE